MARRTFEVQDIHCNSCSAAIRRELGRLAGVTEVEPDERTNTVVVSFAEAEVDTEAIAGRLAEAGFPVKDSTQDEPAAAPNGSPPEAAGRRWPYGLLTLALVITALAGYAGYELYPRFDLPAVDGAGLLALAAGAGIASFFAPCSFPLLVTLLSRQVGTTGRTTTAGGRPLPFALALATGAAGFLVLFGALVALGGHAFAGSVTFTSPAGIALRIAVGAGLIILGLIQLGVWSGSSFRSVEHVTRRLNRAQAGLRRRHPVTGFWAFGFLYLLAGFGWTGPILAGLAGQALVTGGFGAAFLAFAVAALVIMTLMFSAAFVAGRAQEATVRRIRMSAPAVKKWGGALLVGVGLWFVALDTFAGFFAGLFPV